MMNDVRRIEAPPQRGISGRTAALLVLLAFVFGAALTVYTVRRTGWLTPQGPVAQTGSPAPAAVAPVPPLQTDQVTLATREAVLAGQLAALEARTAAVAADAQAAGGQAGRAEALLVAFAARRAIDRGLGLGYLEGQLRARFGSTQPRAVGLVVEAARAPLTLGDLREGLAAIGPALASGAGAGWTAGFRRELQNLIVLRRGGTSSPLPEDRLERARRLLEGGQVEAARAEVARLPGSGQAGNWMQAASRYVTTRLALDALENATLRTTPDNASDRGTIIPEAARSRPSPPAAP